MARANFEAIFDKVTCIYGSSELKRVQVWLERTPKRLLGMRFEQTCTLSSSFDQHLHVSFAKKAENSLDPFLHTHGVRELSSGAVSSMLLDRHGVCRVRPSPNLRQIMILRWGFRALGRDFPANHDFPASCLNLGETTSGKA